MCSLKIMVSSASALMRKKQVDINGPQPGCGTFMILQLSRANKSLKFSLVPRPGKEAILF